MKLLLITLGLLLSLSACESINKKPDATGETDLQHSTFKEDKDTEQYRTAEKYYKAGQLKQAKPAFEAVLKDDPTHIKAHFRLGNIALRGNQLEEAKVHYETVLKQNRRHTKSHYNLGVIYLMQAERYFQYFTATTTQSNDSPRLLKLLESINHFSAEREQKNTTRPADTSLNKLTNLLSR